jgi:hypothetical protein
MDFIELNKNTDFELKEPERDPLKRGDYVRIIRPNNYVGQNHAFFNYKGYQCEIKKIVNNIAVVTINSTWNMSRKAIPLEFLVKE